MDVTASRCYNIDMKVGDLVKIKYDGAVSPVYLVTRIEFVDNYYKSITKPVEWVFLSGQGMPLRPHTLEVVSESR